MRATLGCAVLAAIIMVAVLAGLAVILVRRRKGQGPPESPSESPP